MTPIPSASASAGSRSDAESVKIATRLKASSLGERPGRCGHDTSGDQPGDARPAETPGCGPSRYASGRWTIARCGPCSSARSPSGSAPASPARCSRSTSPTCPSTAVPRSTARRSGLYAALFYLAELVLSPFFGILSDRWGHHRVMTFGPVFGAVAVVAHRPDDEPRPPGRDADPRRRVERREHPVDPRLHRGGDRGRRAAARARRRPASRPRPSPGSASVRSSA